MGLDYSRALPTPPHPCIGVSLILKMTTKTSSSPTFKVRVRWVDIYLRLDKNWIE